MTATAADRVPVRLPRSFAVWLSGALVSQLGDAALYFALGWAASGRGGPAAGLVLSAVSLPRTVLLLIGGAIGDRLGARRVMIAGDSVMLLVAALLAVVSWRWGTPLALLVLAGLIIGTVDAFYLPSAGSMPRYLVEDPQLTRAVALRQSGSQLVSVVGGPIGGVLVAAAGFAAASLADSISFAIVLVVLIVISPRFVPPTGERRNVLRESADGIRVAVRTPGLGAALLLVAGVAGFVIPATSLLVPLLARQHHWTAAAAGLIVGAQASGAIAVSLWVARRGSAPRPGIAAAFGLAIIATGQVILGLASIRLLVIAGGALMGVGTGIFTCNLSPVLLGTAPRSHLARIQALLSLVQSSALLVTNNVLGEVAHATSATIALICCAGVVSLCTLIAWLSPAIRRLGELENDAAVT